MRGVGADLSRRAAVGSGVLAALLVPALATWGGAGAAVTGGMVLDTDNYRQRIFRETCTVSALEAALLDFRLAGRFARPSMCKMLMHAWGALEWIDYAGTVQAVNLRNACYHAFAGRPPP